MYIIMGSRGTITSWWTAVNAACYRAGIPPLRRCQRAALIGNELHFVLLRPGQEAIIRQACQRYDWQCSNSHAIP